MIYTLTLNPSLDYIMETNELKIGKINRTRSTYILPGGKGINVSCVLTNMNIENKAVLPVGGFTGDRLLSMLDELSVHYDAVDINGKDTRINVKVLGQEETQLNAKGMDFTEGDIEQLFMKLDMISEGDFLILSGSVPECLGTDFYAKVMQKMQHKHIKVIVDTSGENLRNSLQYKPFLIKPNREELEEILGKESLENMARKAGELGAVNVLVSMGENGAMLLTQEGELLWQKAPDGQVVNTVGAGDSMVAGFVAGLVNTQKNQKKEIHNHPTFSKADYETALKLAVAAGSASAFSAKLATAQEIDALYKGMCYNER